MKLFKRKTKQQQRKISVKKVYTDKFGNNWFEYSNPLQLPAKRAIAAEVATRFAEMNLTKTNLQLLIGKMKKSANDGNIVDLFSILAEIEYRLNFIGEEQTLMELACCYFLIDGEDESEYNDLFREKKMEIFATDSEAKVFFINGAFQYTIKYSDMSETVIHDYLKMNAPNAEKLNRILRELKLENTLMR